MTWRLPELRFEANPHRTFTLIALVGLALLQIEFNTTFWASRVTGADALLYRVLGICFATVEMFGLGVVTELHQQRRKAARTVWFIIWAGTLMLNFVADIGGVATKIERAGEQRATTADVARQAQRRYDDAARDVASLKAVLQASNLDIPQSAIKAELNSLESIIRRQKRGMPSFAQERRRGVLFAALETARARDSSAAARATAENARDRAPPIASGDAPGLKAITGFGLLVGLHWTVQGVSDFMSIAAALIMQAALTFGYWVVLRPSEQSAPELEIVRNAPKAEEQITPENPTIMATPASPTPSPRRTRRPITTTSDDLGPIGRGQSKTRSA